MKDRFLIVIVALVLCCMPILTSGAGGGQDDVSIRNVPYIVVKGDKLRNVAVRFMVPLKTLKKINRISSRNFTCYPGMTLLVPVKVRPRVWDPSMESSSDAGMLSQDRLPSVDYEVIGDGFDLDMKDDFIPASDAVDDSVQFERVGNHIVKIDRRVSVLSFRMDSLKQTEFTFSHDDDLNSVLGRMRMARDRYYSNGPLGKEIDSLHRVKATLYNLRIRLRNRITENEYLRDNVEYAKANYERDEMAKDRHWGDQITYESNYARIKAKHDELMVSDTAAHPHRDTAVIAPPPVAHVKDTIPASKAIAIDTPRPSPPPVGIPPASTIADSRPAVSPPATTPAVKTATATTTPPTSQPAPAPVVKPAATTPPATTVPKTSPPAPQPATRAATAPVSAPASSAAPRVSFGLLQRVDIAPMVIRHARVNITEHPHQKISLALMPHEAVDQDGAAATRQPGSAAGTAVPTGAAAPQATTGASRADSHSGADTASHNDHTGTNDTPPAPAGVASAQHTMPAAASDTQRRAIPAASATTVKADTSHKSTATAVVAHDTARHATATASQVEPIHKETVARPDTAHKTAAAKVVAHDTASQATAVSQVESLHKEPVAAGPDTARKASAPATIHADTAKQAATEAAPAHTTGRTGTAAGPAQNNKGSVPPGANNFSLADDNDLDSQERDGNQVSKKQESAKTPQPALVTRDKATDATASVVGKPAKKTREPNKKDKVTQEAQDQAPVVVDSSKILHAPEYVPQISREAQGLAVQPGPYFTLDLRFDSAMLYKERKISADPLASYKTDSNFMATDVMLKEIPITEVKNKPKYLIAVDSVSRIKGEFYLIRARQVLERGDFKEGDKYLRKSLELDPNNAATWMLHADLCLTTGAADKALKEYAISSEIDSSNPKVFYNIALLYAKANDNQKAYKYFSRATDVNDKYLLAYMGRATVLMDERDYEGAIQDYDKTLGINRYYSPAYKGRALAKMEAHKFEDAVVDFNQYLEIEDPDGYVLYQRGIAKILSNNLLQGCLDLSSSLELGFREADRAIKKFCQ